MSELRGGSLDKDLETIKSDIEVNKNGIKNLEGSVKGLASGSPKGTYESVEKLVSANPDTGVYIITNNGHIYSWIKDQKESAIDLGIYTNIIDYDKNFEDLTLLSYYFKINTINLFKSLTFHHLKSIPFNDRLNITVDNFNEKLIDSIYGDISSPLKIKLDNGFSIFERWNFINLPSTSEAVFMYYFKKDKSFLSYKNLHNPNVDVIPAEAYYVSFVKYNNLTDYYIQLDTVNVEWLNTEDRENIKAIEKKIESLSSSSEIIENYIVDINGSGDYTSLMDCFTALQNNTNKKVIEIMDGTYNIFEEIGGSKFATSITSEQKWNDENVSIFIPDNTKIIGRGNVILNFLPEQDETNQYAAQYLSPINVRSNCEIENIKIYAKNCRYCIHDETSSQTKYENTYRKYKGVECHYLKSQYGTGPGGQSYAAGFTSGMTYEFDNCLFEGQYRNQAWSMHNGNGTTKSNNIFLRNCIFKAPGSQAAIGLANTSTKQLLNNVYISNCYLNNQLVIYNNYTSEKLINAFKLYINNCNDFSIDIKTTINELEPEIYNVIRNS